MSEQHSAFDAAPAPRLPVSVAEMAAYLRLATADDDALLAGLIASASALCEAFTGQTLLWQWREVTVTARDAWTPIPLLPVHSVSVVEQILADGSRLVITDYAVDIDGDGRAWVRLSGGQSARVVVRVQAGLADRPGDLPEPLRQGIMRLVAHLYAARDDARDVAPPAAVTALWQPWRRFAL